MNKHGSLAKHDIGFINKHIVRVKKAIDKTIVK